MQNIQDSDLIKININLPTTITNRYSFMMWTEQMHQMSFVRGKRKLLGLTLFEVGEVCSIPPLTVNQPRLPKRPPNTPKFRDFSYFYKICFITVIFSVLKKVVLNTLPTPPLNVYFQTGRK